MLYKFSSNCQGMHFVIFKYSLKLANRATNELVYREEESEEEREEERFLLADNRTFSGRRRVTAAEYDTALLSKIRL